MQRLLGHPALLACADRLLGHLALLATAQLIARCSPESSVVDRGRRKIQLRIRHATPGYLLCPRQVGERMLRFPGYLLCHPRTVERMNGSCMPRSVQPPLRSVPAWSNESLPGYLICPRQVGERKIYCPAAVIALPVVLRAALICSLAPTYVVLDSTMEDGKDMDLQKRTPSESTDPWMIPWAAVGCRRCRSPP